MSKFIDAYSITTGRKQVIPASWYGHPVLGKNFALTPSFRAAINRENHITQTPASGDDEKE